MIMLRMGNQILNSYTESKQSFASVGMQKKISQEKNESN